MSTLQITKYAHATVTLSRGGSTVLLDPGVFTAEAAELLAAADALLITHDHPDHIDVDAVRAALTARPELPLHTTAEVAALLGDLAGRATIAEPGTTFTAAGLEVRAVGGQHAVIHGDLPAMSNVGFVVEDVYHPGDSYDVPGVEVDTLLLPTSGPWAKVGEGVDFVRAVAPRRSVQIHDALLSDLGRGSMGSWVGSDGLTGVPLLSPQVGETV